MTPATTCGTCGVPLPPDAAKRGVLICPKCAAAEEQTTPTATGRLATPPAPPVNDPYQQFTVFDEQTEWIYDSTELTSGTRYQELPVDVNKVAVPRRVIYLQGILLSLVAISCFSLGMLVGQQNATVTNRPAPSQPCLIQGLVSYTSNNGQRMPDDRAVIIAIPEMLKLDEKLNHRDLGITEHPPDTNRHPDLLLLRTSGGNHAWSNTRGEYRLQLAQTGDYFFLILSRHRDRPDNFVHDRKQLAQIGRYFESAIDLLGNKSYHWERVTIKKSRTFDRDFSP
ncbi:MAG: hypothetical protein CMJ75_03425 [Planctomycetaceae bacterium]|nr:hypothetical protein [Planctomycetaceae bacterium]